MSTLLLYWFTIEKKITTYFLMYILWSLFPNFVIVVASQDKKTHNTVGTQRFYWQDGGLSPTSRDVNVTVNTLPSSKLVIYPFLVELLTRLIQRRCFLKMLKLRIKKRKLRKGRNFKNFIFLFQSFLWWAYYFRIDFHLWIELTQFNPKF